MTGRIPRRGSVALLYLAIAASIVTANPLLRFNADLDRGATRRLSATGPVVLAPESALPGDLVRVFIVGGPLDRLVDEIQLVDDTGRTVTSAFPIRLSMAGAVYTDAFLLGVDSTMKPGTYDLIGLAPARVDELERSMVFVRALVVEELWFRSSEFSLSASLTTLRADPDPEKDRQTRVLTSLILSRDPQAVHHVDALLRPLPATTRRTGLFGDRRIYLYSTGVRSRTIHVGLDLAAPTGTPVHGSGAGIVRMAEFRIVTGGTVVIEHLPGLFTLYYHLDEVFARAGEVIGAGAVIGTVGATGLATGPHLHWEVRVNGVPISPEELTRRGLLAPSGNPRP